MSQLSTVMLVGASGVGKSTLGNYLLSVSERDGFATGTGTNTVTTECQSREDYSVPGQPLRVIDTPGIPDPNGKTATYFNRIVTSAREAGSLHALILVIDYAADRNHLLTTFENASILLEQFSKLGCSILIACRVPNHLPGREKSSILRDVNDWTAFVNDIARAACLDAVAIFLLQTSDMISNARDMRSDIVQCLAINVIGNRGMLTFDELETSLTNRIDEDKRRYQLHQDVERLERDNEALSQTAFKLVGSAERCREAGRWANLGVQSIAMAIDVGTLGALLFVPTAIGTILGLGAREVGTSLQRMKEREALLKRARVTTNSAAIAAMKNELEADGIDVEQINLDKEKLEKLRSFLQN